MIRKDQLPNYWGDDWHNSATPYPIAIAPGKSQKLVFCHPADAAVFMLSAEKDYTLLPTMGHIVMEIGQDCAVELYTLQGMNTPAQWLTQLDITMQRGAQLRMCTVTLGGQHVRNNITVRMQGEGASLVAGGLYLIDREQQCDNYIFVEHAKPHCTSNELYKGIMDDAARARFNGHVLVQDGAVKTEAYMINRNILLTDKAHVDTRPFLEIYNDDVKCSHGSTIGQLDEQALFYLQTRGICHKTAITMLSYAFCDEVIREIGIPSLRDAVGDMVKKRLHGELTPCDECAIQCTSPCNGPDAHFNIDPSKL